MTDTGDGAKDGEGGGEFIGFGPEINQRIQEAYRTLKTNLADAAIMAVDEQPALATARGGAKYAAASVLLSLLGAVNWMIVEHLSEGDQVLRRRLINSLHTNMLMGDEGIIAGEKESPDGR